MLKSLVEKALNFIPDPKLRDEARLMFEKGLPSVLASEVKLKLAEMNKGGINSWWRPYGAFVVFTALAIRWILYPLTTWAVVVFDLNIYLPEPYGLPDAFYHLSLAFVTMYGYVRSRYDKKKEILGEKD